MVSGVCKAVGPAKPQDPLFTFLRRSLHFLYFLYLTTRATCSKAPKTVGYCTRRDTQTCFTALTLNPYHFGDGISIIPFSTNSYGNVVHKKEEKIPFFCSFKTKHETGFLWSIFSFYCFEIINVAIHDSIILVSFAHNIERRRRN